MVFDDPEGLDAVASLTDDLDTLDLSEQEAQLIPRQLLVVDDHGPQTRPCQAEILVGTISSGITIRAQVPSPGTLSSWSW